MQNYLMALDQGTTSSRCIIFDTHSNIVTTSQQEFKNYFPKEGWVEHDPMEIWDSQINVAKEAYNKIDLQKAKISAIGITNQRETTIVWDKRTGKPVCNAIVWQCRRTAEYCESLSTPEIKDMIHKKTGLIVDAYFSATKLKWILDNIEGAREKAENGDLLFGTVDCWLIYNLTGGKVHATDVSNASRTMLFNINKLEWDQELLDFFGIPKKMLPEVKPSSGIFGYTDRSIFGVEIPIAGAAGDQQAALFGQCCFNKGNVKNTYGTGGFMLMNTGDKPIISENGLVTTIGWTINGKTTYVLEGSAFICGAAIQWLRDGLKIISKASESENVALSVENTGGVYFVPAFVGLGAPWWDPYARATLIGITRSTTSAHIVRAVLEAMAYQTSDILRLMENESGASLSSLKVDGGACANDFLMQFQSDILNLPIIRPKCIETTALGAANLAGLAVGLWDNFDEISKSWGIDRSFDPDMQEDIRKTKLKYWAKAVERSKGWAI